MTDILISWIYIASLASQCPGPYTIDPQHTLTGFAKATADAKSLADCVSLCLNAQQNLQFTCKSGMFYSQVTSENCILNVETKASKPDLYTAETTDTVEYFDSTCTGEWV